MKTNELTDFAEANESVGRLELATSVYQKIIDRQDSDLGKSLKRQCALFFARKQLMRDGISNTYRSKLFVEVTRWLNEQLDFAASLKRRRRSTVNHRLIGCERSC